MNCFYYNEPTETYFKSYFIDKNIGFKKVIFYFNTLYLKLGKY